MGTSGTLLQYVMSIVWVLSFIEPDNYLTTMYRLTIPLRSSALEIKVSIRVSASCTILAFSTENNENKHLIANFTEGNILLKERTQMMNNKIKLHILRVPMNKLGH